MTASVIQDVYNGVQATNTTISATIVPSAGNLIHAIVYGFATSTITISDTQSNTYFPLDTGINFGGFNMSHWYAKNVPGGSVTVTGLFSNSRADRVIVLREIGGVDANNPADGNNFSTQATPTTSADAVTVSATNARQPVLISAFSLRAGFNAAFTVGTGFTVGVNGTSSGDSNAGAYMAESKRITSTGSQSATFTAGNNGNVITLIAMFDEPTVATNIGRALLLGVG